MKLEFWFYESNLAGTFKETATRTRPLYLSLDLVEDAVSSSGVTFILIFVPHGSPSKFASQSKQGHSMKWQERTWRELPRDPRGFKASLIFFNHVAASLCREGRALDTNDVNGQKHLRQAHPRSGVDPRAASCSISMRFKNAEPCYAMLSF